MERQKIQMSKYQSDEKIAECLNRVLPDVLNEREEQCISNSVVIDNKHGHYIMYVARGKRQQLLIVLINLTAQKEPATIHLIPIKVKHQQSLEDMWFQITPSPYVKTIFSFLAYDPKAQSSNSKQIAVYFAPFQINQNGGEKLKEVELHMIQTREHGRVKDVRWYPFAALTLVMLTDIKIITFNLQMDHINPINQIYLKDLTVSIINETVKSNQFQYIAFSNILNHKQQYSSLGKKITTYLISKTGEIYLLFPFICPEILLNENELEQFDDVKERLLTGNRLQYDKHKLTLLEWVAKANIRKVEENEYEESTDNQNQEDMYGIEFHQDLSILKIQLFKLNPTSYCSKYNNTMKSTCKSVSSFKVLQLNQHTIFLHDEKSTNNKDYQLKVQIFSQQPYDRLLSQIKHTSHFVLQTVGEFKFSKSQALGQRQIDTIKLLTQNSMTNDIFLLHNNLTCYRLTLDGLYNLLSSSHTDSLNDKLIDCDVLFKSLSQLVTITNNQSTIYFIRYQNNTYIFQSVPLQSIQLSQTIRNTIQQTQNLFRKLGNKPLPNLQKNGKQQEKLQFAKLNQSTLIGIEKQLAKFNQDSKKYIESKLERVKTLYQSIISKQSLLQQQQRQKQQLINLINQAEQNDNKIKQITSQNNKNFNRTQRDLERRIRSMHKSLDNMKETFERQNQQIQKDDDKRETMEQCIQQADVVISKLEEMKQKLIEKRDELRKAQALA